jgi:hypothetical protein
MAWPVCRYVQESPVAVGSGVNEVGVRTQQAIQGDRFAGPDCLYDVFVHAYLRYLVEKDGLGTSFAKWKLSAVA